MVTLIIIDIIVLDHYCDHDCRLSIRITGSETIGDDGYVIDFGDIKKATRKLCKALNEYFICPMKSDALEITEIDNQVCTALLS